MVKLTSKGALGAGLLVALAVTAGAPASAETRAAPVKRDCFYLSDWDGWSAPDRDTLLLRVRNREVYRVDLHRGTNQLDWPGTHLVSVVRGSDRVCHPNDLDLSVADTSGFSIPIRAKAITKLSAAEKAALSKRDRP